ncbi:hypothetical protein [Lentibacter sp. XHP0401]|uniref:hypothetical protein n=1 Tax=Lentibacter sp. XHP0401 TaxID=2984334 RepID=UPI0021E7E692|nr:hypothetical protein [Lentibacter sp. XHP0401]MCV2893109.1 hypothetical protein [Lentibacter sp. XHP0401]
MTRPAQAAAHFTMTLRNNNWLCFGNIGHAATQTFSSVFLIHTLDTIGPAEVRNPAGFHRRGRTSANHFFTIRPSVIGV